MAGSQVISLGIRKWIFNVIGRSTSYAAHYFAGGYPPTSSSIPKYCKQVRTDGSSIALLMTTFSNPRVRDTTNRCDH